MFINFFNKDEDEKEQQQSQQTATAAPAPAPLNYRKQNNLLHNRFTHFQYHSKNNNNNNSSNFDTYPPKRNNIKKQLQNNFFSTTDILQTTSTLRRAMSSSRNSPLRNINSSGKFYTKRSVKKSYSGSSAERLQQRYTTSDSTSSQEEDELMMNSTDKRKMTRRSISSGLHQHHKYQQRSQRRTSQSFEAGDYDNDDGGIGVVGCTTIFGQHSHYVSDMIDIGIRVILVVVFSKLETQTAFKRIIHSEEMWMYKNPRTKDYVSPLSLLLAVILGPFFVTLIHLALTKDRRDFRAASWAWTLILGLNGLATSLLKISVGRPRPDFYYRCFPDGVMQLAHNGTGLDNMLDLFNCTGNPRDINEGRKSFPSGHSSFAFAGFGFITYYVGAKLHAFNHRGRGESWRFCVSVTPLVLAALIAVSRTCDYHHHWEDVVIGSLIGLFVSYYIYRQYYPSIFSPTCHRAYYRGDQLPIIKTLTEHTIHPRSRRRLHSYKRVPSEECGEASLLCEGQGEGFTADVDKRPLLSEQKTENKWF
ncbi:uncharacterized protein ACRADG_012707 isoform 2-T3 [Cochliomyia hominivorax]